MLASESLDQPCSRSSPSSPAPENSNMSSLPIDIMKNPFLLPAHLLALNPGLYAAQFAQLQAAQLLISKQNSEDYRDGSDRKRSAGDDSPLDLGSRSKYPRSSSPCDKERSGESPLDLSGNKSPELKQENSFNPVLPSNILSFFNQLKPPVAGSEFSTLLSLAANNKSNPSSSPPRSNPWQSQWINKTKDGGKICDVFKCVWCKESYQTLEDLTTHMKDAKHHAMPYPMHSSASMLSMPPSVSSPSRSMSSPVSTMSTSPKPSPGGRDILKEQLPLPRKLVRGQDIWIGKADQQTRDILKCMGCGQSFRSLDLLTKHMQETQHYKKVISHDQLSAWKYPEAQHTSKSHINSVLTCKVCEKGFGTLKDLSEHMIKANHYTGDSRGARTSLPSPAALARERKKALPVKKLLELERARHEIVGGSQGSKAAAASARDIMESGKLLCERCEDRIPLDIFISHIQQCVGRNISVPIPPIKTEDLSYEGSDRSSDSDQKKDSHSSILGSLEQMVKGNFQASMGRKFTVPSPPSSLHSLYNPVNSLTKFSVSNMIPRDSSISPGSSSSVSSKSSSPHPPPSSQKPLSPPPALSSKPSSPPSLEKSTESPDGQTNGKIKQEIDSNNQTDGSAASPSPSLISSPTPQDINENPVRQRIESPDLTKLDIKPERSQHLQEEEGEKKSSNPLAALQLLCDTQRKSPKNPRISEPSQISDPGAMMAFSWACNQAVSTDSVIKCPFCDTPFISKGAYRHHLSKMHFTKEPGVVGFPGARSPSPDTKDDLNIQSKYAKYAQLAKQLSCNQK